MIQGRIAVVKQWLLVEDPDGIIKAYRKPEDLAEGRYALSAFTWPEINASVAETIEQGMFDDDTLVRTVGATRFPPEIDKCTRCGNEFPNFELSYEGVEPVVYGGKCHICMIAGMQEEFGAENVQLPRDFTN